MTEEELDALVKDVRLASRVLADTRAFETGQAILIEAADAITALRAELAAERAKVALQLDQKDALCDSAYQAGVKLGWNLGVTEDEVGFKAATSSTEHIAELRRIKDALKGGTAITATREAKP